MRTLAALLAAFGVACLAGAQSASADYPDPRQAGFHHCALIYDRPQRTPADLAPYVARTERGRAREWLFDAFLFLIQESGQGIRTEYGATRRVDWRYQLDRWFAPGRDLAALDAAVDAAARDLGPQARRRVILSIPYPNPQVRDFEDVDGDGRPEDLATSEGRRAVLRWYVGEARRRFAEAGFRHLDLWGFYWMREDMAAGDEARISEAAAVVHSSGLRLLWIPWFRAPGWDRWQAAGIDVAILQPNYAFWSSGHDGSIRRNRLAVTANLARGAGLGVEMEAGDPIESEADRRAFTHYLEDGAPDRLGYRRGAQAYYLGIDLVERTALAGDPRARSIYRALADYIAGRQVRSPDAEIAWKWRDARGGRVRTADAILHGPTWVHDVELYLDEPGPIWQGVVQVEVRDTAASRWTPGGWAIRASRDEGAGRSQVVVVPVRRRVAALRVTLRSRDARRPPPAVTPAIDPSGERGWRSHLAVGRPYRVTPAWPAAYGDDGAKLTDGIVPESGFTSGRMVGWYGVDAAVLFDLGRATPIDRIEICCSGGSAAAIHWPRYALALLSAADRPPTAAAGVGSLPKDLTWLGADPIVVDRTRSATDMDGRLIFRAAPGAAARFVTLAMGADGWLMLSEVRIFSRGENVAPSARYLLDPPPTPRQTSEPSYPDDGRKLTDGRVAESFAPPRLAGWSDDGPRRIEVDLGEARPVSEVTAWCLGGGLHGIQAPALAEVEGSLDERAWTSLGVAEGPRETGGRECRPVALRVRTPHAVRARWVRVTIRRSAGWAMVSEIEVRSPDPGGAR